MATFGEVFPGGGMIELVERTSDNGKLRLLAWDGAEAKIRAQVQLNGRVYKPALIEPDVLQAMTFPSRVIFCGSARQLLTDICVTVQRYSGLQEELCKLVGRFVLASWLVGSRPTAPRLSIYGDELSAGGQLLRLLSCLCRRPLRLAHVDAASIRSLPMKWRPTLLIHQAVLDARTQRLLDDVRTRDLYIPHHGRLLDLHCAVATFSEMSHCRKAGIEIQMPVADKLPTVDSSSQQRIAACFQPKLLGYRLGTYDDASRSTLEIPGLTSAMKDTAGSLASCTPHDPDLQVELVGLLKHHIEDPRTYRSADLNCIIIGALVACCHMGNDPMLYVSQIAHLVETILQGRNETTKITAKRVGTHLRLLGLAPERQGPGYGLRLTQDMHRRIHKLARQFSVLTPDAKQERCPDCSS